MNSCNFILVESLSDKLPVLMKTKLRGFSNSDALKELDADFLNSPNLVCAALSRYYASLIRSSVLENREEIDSINDFLNEVIKSNDASAADIVHTEFFENLDGVIEEAAKTFPREMLAALNENRRFWGQEELIVE